MDQEDIKYLITSPYEYQVDQNVTSNVQIFGSKSCEVILEIADLSVSANGIFEPGKRGNLTLRVMYIIPSNKHSCMELELQKSFMNF